MMQGITGGKSGKLNQRSQARENAKARKEAQASSSSQVTKEPTLEEVMIYLLGNLFRGEGMLKTPTRGVGRVSHNNSLSGRLPDIFINATMSNSLDVSHNRLVGKLPTSLRDCSSLEILNVGNNQINDTFPFRLNSLQMLQVLVLGSNKFHGVLHHPQDTNGFPHMRIIDVSHNNFTAIDFSGNKIQGGIPESIGLLKGLRVLNLSSNGFTGNIPLSLANLTKLESLDLSQNKLSGEIPPKLGNMHSLAWINVSHNQLVGSIPQSIQFQRHNCSSYEGNPGIFGPSLKDVCGDNYTPTSHQPEPVESEEEEEWFSWVAAGLGVAPGVVFGLTIGYIVLTYKHEWFMKPFCRNKHRTTRTH